jgi:hypothetical protein
VLHRRRRARDDIPHARRQSEEPGRKRVVARERTLLLRPMPAFHGTASRSSNTGTRRLDSGASIDSVEQRRWTIPRHQRALRGVVPGEIEQESVERGSRTRAPARFDEKIAFLEGGASCGNFRPVRAPYCQALRHSCQAASREAGTPTHVPSRFTRCQDRCWSPREKPRLNRLGRTEFRRAARPGARMRPPCRRAK